MIIYFIKPKTLNMDQDNIYKQQKEAKRAARQQRIELMKQALIESGKYEEMKNRTKQ